MNSMALRDSPVPEIDLRSCVEPLLGALHWRGTARQLADARTTSGNMDLLDLRNTLANLDFTSRLVTTRLDEIDARLLPCLFLSSEGGALVVLESDAATGDLGCFDAAAGTMTNVAAAERQGTACFFSLDQQPAGVAAMKGSWVRALLHRFDATVLRLLGISFVISLLALVPAFFVQVVYDHVLATQERTALVYLAVGVGLALAGDTVLRLVRSAALAHIGARLDFLIGVATLKKLLSLPLARLEKTGVGAQIARLREFEALRQVFVGPLAQAMLELPFLFVYVLALALIGGWLAMVPVLLAVALAGLGIAALGYARGAARRSILSQGDHQAMLVEILANMRAIKAGAAEGIWLERFRERSAQAAFSHLHHARIGALTENIAQAINLVAGAATLSIGAVLALDGALSIGALIASMALVWRALVPVQALFLASARIEEVGNASRGIDQMMGLPCETGIDSGRPATARGRRFAGRISFSRVVLRYAPHHEPALAGVSFELRPGEIVAVTGGNGCGKSSVVKLVANLYQPQAGAVLIDGVDTRQVSPVDLRQAIAYLPQHSDLFAGTLADNLRLAQPTASDAALRDACARAGVLSEIEALPAGFATRSDESLSANLVRRLALARTWLIDASIILLDEPGPILDANGEDLLLHQLEALRGRATVLLVTHTPEHVRAADRVIVLRLGTVVHDGSPQELMAKLSGAAR